MDFSLFSSSENKQEVTRIAVDKIVPNPYQPRKDFTEQDIRELADSIENFGVIQPIIVSQIEDGFQLIAGERRLRAAKMAGANNIPAIIKNLSQREIAEVALVENLQRKDLGFIEEAAAYSRMLNEFGLTQEELAKKLGKSQSTIANKLRLLQLPEKVRNKLNSGSFSERHARALLRLEKRKDQLKVLAEIRQKDLTVKETLEMVEEIKTDQENENKQGGSVKTVFKDLRLFKNTLNQTINEMKEAGLDVKVEQEREAEHFKYTIFLPRSKNKGRD